MTRTATSVYKTQFLQMYISAIVAA